MIAELNLVLFFFLNIGSSRLDLTFNRVPQNLEEVLNNLAMTVNLGEAEIFNRLNPYLETNIEYVIHLDCSVDLETFSSKCKWSKSDGMLCKSYENLKVFLDVKGRVWSKKIINLEQANRLAHAIALSLQADDLVRHEVATNVKVYRIRGTLSLGGRPDYIRLLARNRRCFTLIDGSTLRYSSSSLPGQIFKINASGEIEFESPTPLTTKAFWKIARLKGIGVSKT